MTDMRSCDIPDWNSVSSAVIESSTNLGELLNFSVLQFLKHWREGIESYQHHLAVSRALQMEGKRKKIV